MPPRGVTTGSKRARQYEHIKDSARSRGMSDDRAEEMAARTVSKERSEAEATSRGGRGKARKSGGGSRQSSGGSRKSSSRSGARKSSGSRQSSGARAKSRKGARKSASARVGRSRKSTGGSRKSTARGGARKSTARTRKAGGTRLTKRTAGGRSMGGGAPAGFMDDELTSGGAGEREAGGPMEDDGTDEDL